MIRSTNMKRGLVIPLLLLFEVFGQMHAQSSTPTCKFRLDDGSMVTLEKGALLDKFRPNRCTDSASFPCFCNPEAPGQIECPYCWLPSNAGELLCVHDGDSVTYTSKDGILETCACKVSKIEFGDFTTDCSPIAATTKQATTDGDDDADGNDQGSLLVTSQPGDTCTINGITFDRGQPLGVAYDSGCAGSSFDFQCLCNPDHPTQIDCPFCYFDAGGSHDPLCLRDGEIATFKNTLGEVQTCGCTMDFQGNPRSECLLPSDTANTCAIEVPDGSIETFVAGESLHRVKPTRCGADYPCYCEPKLLGQVWCPYCVYPGGTESLICANDGETVTYTNSQYQQQTCTCTVPLDPSEPPVSTCTSIFDDHGSPRPPSVTQPPSTPQPPSFPQPPWTSSNPFQPPSAPPFPQFTPDDDGDSDADAGAIPGTTDMDPWRVCELEGNLFFEGENVGSSFVTRCGSPDDFPCYCNPDLSPPVECPYCGFALSKENLLCLKHEQVATFVDIDGDELTCGCKAPLGTVNPVKDCLLEPAEANTCVFRDGDGNPVTFSAGDPVDDDLLPLSYCGTDYPCYCDPNAPDQLTCPFCVDVDFSGALVCANQGEQAPFVNEFGERQLCSCEKADNLPGGPPSLNCDNAIPAPPTTSPRPTGTPSPQDAFSPTGTPSPNSTPSPTITPSPFATRPTNGTFPTYGTSPPTGTSGGSCSVQSPTGETVTIPNGDSFGNLVNDGACGSSVDWPSFCNAYGLTPSQQIKYPYCPFPDGNGNIVCARDGGQVSFVDPTGTAVICSCLYDTSPQTQCLPDTSQLDGSAPMRTPSLIRQFVLLFVLLLSSAY